jgi:hypothetical protein
MLDEVHAFDTAIWKFNLLAKVKRHQFQLWRKSCQIRRGQCRQQAIPVSTGGVLRGHGSLSPGLGQELAFLERVS